MHCTYFASNITFINLSMHCLISVGGPSLSIDADPYRGTRGWYNTNFKAQKCVLWFCFLSKSDFNKFTIKHSPNFFFIFFFTKDQILISQFLKVHTYRKLPLSHFVYCDITFLSLEWTPAQILFFISTSFSLYSLHRKM